MPCRLRKKAENTVTLLYESGSWQHTSFLTFTFNDDNIDPYYSLRTETMPLFHKRLRKELAKQGRNVKFFYNGEYGDEGSRPHHHGIYFGIHPQLDRELIEDTWGQGFIDSSAAIPNNMDYVCGYIQSKINGALAEDYYGGRLPPFHHASQGLGLEFARENLKQIEQLGYITRHGQKMPVPRYFKRKLGINASDAPIRAQEEFEEYENFYKNMGWGFYDREAIAHRKGEAIQVEKNLAAQAEMRTSKRRQNGKSL